MLKVSVLDTRSSAIADGPREALCQLKSCQLHAGTSCTTNSQQMEVMELEHYGRPTEINYMCVQPRRVDRGQQARPSTSFVDNTIDLPPNFSKFRVWNKGPDGNTLNFGDTRISLQHSIRHRCKNVEIKIKKRQKRKKRDENKKTFVNVIKKR